MFRYEHENCLPSSNRTLASVRSFQWEIPATALVSLETLLRLVENTEITHFNILRSMPATTLPCTAYMQCALQPPCHRYPPGTTSQRIVTRRTKINTSSGPLRVALGSSKHCTWIMEEKVQLSLSFQVRPWGRQVGDRCCARFRSDRIFNKTAFIHSLFRRGDPSYNTLVYGSDAVSDCTAGLMFRSFVTSLLQTIPSSWASPSLSRGPSR